MTITASSSVLSTVVHASLVDKANCLFKAVVNHGAAAAKPDIFWQPRDPSASLCQPIYSLEGSISPTISLVQTSFKEARQGINLEPVVTADLMASKATKRPSSRWLKYFVIFVSPIEGVHIHQVFVITSVFYSVCKNPCSFESAQFSFSKMFSEISYGIV